MTVTRRRFLAISGAACVTGAPVAWAATHRWRGIALGAAASITFVGLPRSEAVALSHAVEAETARLEELFSLYHPSSAISRLNRSGHLDAPAPEMLELLGLAYAVHATTGGAFDPTVQPLWALQAEAAAAGRQPAAAEIAACLATTGWSGLEVHRTAIRFRRPNMALTLNGIAQGYIADRISALLRARGLVDVLVDMGEIQARGSTPDGTPWSAGIARPDGTIVRRCWLSDRALATSAPMGTLLDPAGRVGHILDPHSGRSEGRWSLVSVSAPSAALADALSTAFCLMDRRSIDRALAAHSDTTLEVLET